MQTTIPKALRVYSICHGTKILLIQFPHVSSAACLYLGNPTITDLYIILGVSIWWPFQEWWAHWLILHAKPQKIGSFRFEIPGAVVHRFHHRHLDNMQYLFLGKRSPHLFHTISLFGI